LSVEFKGVDGGVVLGGDTQSDRCRSGEREV
jgi:hypothetical protein